MTKSSPTLLISTCSTSRINKVMTEVSTVYTFRAKISGEPIETTLKVPFSRDEMSQLEAARNLVLPWREHVLDGPTIYRDLVIGLKIPWADRLSNRDVAITDVKDSLKFIETIMNLSPRPKNYGDVLEDLTSLQSNLLSFFKLE